MGDSLFLVTGGGTGAKVAEALVHLCAAGLGPKRLHVLMIDSDTSNGNLNRTVATLKAYKEMQQWPWSVNAHVNYGFLRGSGSVELNLFRTKIEFSELTEQIATVLNGGIETAVHDRQMHQVLDLLYDPDEQKARCDDGFRARPNLGCLLMAAHLKEKLPQKAGRFLDSLRAAVTNEKVVPIAVTASVFGGTGASLLPIIRGSIERVLQLDEEKRERLRWSAVKMLPHYQPEKMKESVDPDRYLLDTASALQYYSTIYRDRNGRGPYDAIYTVGSDKPGRNRVKSVLGHSSQANPAYFEEAVASLALLHFANDPDQASDRPMRVYHPKDIGWDTLPYVRRDQLRDNMGYLLHLAAFFLRRGNLGGQEQMSQGLATFLQRASDEDIRAYPWYEEVLDEWAASFHGTYKAADGTRRVQVLKSSASMGANSIDAMLAQSGEYFGRLLLWAQTALKGEQLRFFDTSGDNYAGVYSSMSEVKSKEIDTSTTDGAIRHIPPEADNALIRILRTSVTAMARDHKLAVEKGRNTAFRLVDDEAKILLRTSPQQIRDTLRDLGLGRIIDEYFATQITTNGA